MDMILEFYYWTTRADDYWASDIKAILLTYFYALVSMHNVQWSPQRYQIPLAIDQPHLLRIQAICQTKPTFLQRVPWMTTFCIYLCVSLNTGTTQINSVFSYNYCIKLHFNHLKYLICTNYWFTTISCINLFQNLKLWSSWSRGISKC